jgi:Uma2 family endonuclease
MKYALMGVEEYFAYDPNEPPLSRFASRRLFGWQLDRSTQAMQALPIGLDGELWSPHLDSFLIADGELLRLYDKNRLLRLTKAEALSEKLRSLGIDPDQL